MGKYKRAADGKFAGASTIKQNRAKNTAEKKRRKKALSGNAVGGKNKRVRSGVRLKAHGTKAVTKAARNSTQRHRKRFG